MRIAGEWAAGFGISLEVLVDGSGAERGHSTTGRCSDAGDLAQGRVLLDFGMLVAIVDCKIVGVGADGVVDIVTAGTDSSQEALVHSLQVFGIDLLQSSWCLEA